MHVTQLEVQRSKVYTLLQNMIILDHPKVTIFLYSKGDEIPTMPSFRVMALQTGQQHSYEEKCRPRRDLCYSTASSLTSTEWLQA